MEKLDYIIDYLLKECGKEDFDYSNRDKKRLYRALVNRRLPKHISEDFLKVEDEYLQEELKLSTVIDEKNIIVISKKYDKYNLENADKIALYKGDITKLKIDAIVNPGNSQGLGCFLENHNCLDNQINTFARY